MKDLLANIDLYDNDTPGMAQGGRIGFKDGMKEMEDKLRANYNKKVLKKLDAGKKSTEIESFQDYIKTQKEVDMNPGKKKLEEAIDKANKIRLAKIGCPGKATGGRIGFFEGQNLNACAAQGLQKLKTTEPKNLTLADRANYKAIRKTSQGARVLKNVLGPGALAIEALFAAPFAAYDYARGRSGIDTFKSAASLGLLDQKLTDAELKKIYPEYGAAENLQNIGDRLSTLEKMQKGTRGQKIRSKPKFKKAEQEFKTALQPFLETGDAGKAYLENIKKSQEAEQELDRQYKETAEGRTTKFDLSDPFMAAGGGIAKMAGVDQGPPPESGPMSQGLQGLMKRVRNL